MQSVSSGERYSMKENATNDANTMITSRMVPLEISRCTKPISATARVIMSPIVYWLKKREPKDCRCAYNARRKSNAIRSPARRTAIRAQETMMNRAITTATMLNTGMNKSGLPSAIRSTPTFSDSGIVASSSLATRNRQIPPVMRPRYLPTKRPSFLSDLIMIV